ncbi:E3 ubiquitin-protein ligase Ubr3-like [Lucilia sericata]|uniref:E3 ubiquitin-protein ligase Ubr3-like n=1 Tax=Lucilia sericata TaxID=13632 RepID=UPI0018A85A36|nr:E3 ubiquitin-protein ligase Ubr3-like [Lucilia sericata]XP_037823095.1 E3 ubiquitin-protein ligase Ubr3-like [Lucilia sericata]XP_037823096.1 E3 ubiquitin-protein ligase Ubr3-like [Lucilia sericata]XP_037823097.1 E3 ubiquitin-protein ligase Ubr3-like [Lucilia sericata]XP_037823098.1 E3 ubiquitin-protein ligase Ubr3-like [Lucilia sericata]XP_037823099.1 E3 ubiquitin-protein ligase Ubr3-like [Lucilia sericata]XP_037823102.1 E3 ubiquitin-protein ligase Ubr3-like [Lucilia sericata]XP_03782310
MDEDDNNLDNNRAIISGGEEEPQEEEFDDDDDLLDTIEVTVTTDGAPLPRDDNEDIEIINLSPQQAEQQQQAAGNLAAANTTHDNTHAPALLNFSEDLHNGPWDRDEIEDSIMAQSYVGPSTSSRANALISVISSSSANSAEGAAAASSSGGGAVPSYCFDTSSFCSRTRKEVAALIVAECCSGGPTPDLNYIMDRFFNPSTPIDNPDNISWIRWLIAGGRTISDFVKIGK